MEYLPFGGQSSADLFVKLGGPVVKVVIPRPSAEHVLTLSYGHTARVQTQQNTYDSSRRSLTDEGEISEPVACFCIQRCGLESAAAVDERLEATGASAWADGVPTGSCLFDALLDACKDKDEVGKDG